MTKRKGNGNGKEKWTIIDRWLRRYRVGRVQRYIEAGLSGRGVLVDVGCGDGTILRELSSRFARGVGYDMKTPSSTTGNVEIVNAYLSRAIPLPDASADVVVMLALIEHMDDPEPLLRDARRVLREGGRIVITTPAPSCDPLLRMMAFLRMVSREEIRDHKHYYSRPALRDLLSRCGYSHVRTGAFQFGLNNYVVATT
jgi:SAM-dependent methyltransferase